MIQAPGSPRSWHASLHDRPADPMTAVVPNGAASRHHDQATFATAEGHEATRLPAPNRDLSNRSQGIRRLPPRSRDPSRKPPNPSGSDALARAWTRAVALCRGYRPFSTVTSPASCCLPAARAARVSARPARSNARCQRQRWPSSRRGSRAPRVAIARRGTQAASAGHQPRRPRDPGLERHGVHRAGRGGRRAVTADCHGPRSPWIQGLWAGARVGSLSSTS